MARPLLVVKKDTLRQRVSALLFLGALLTWFFVFQSSPVFAYVTANGEDDNDDAIVVANTNAGADDAVVKSDLATLPPNEAASPVTQGVLLGAGILAVGIVLLIVRLAVRKKPPTL